MRRGTAQRAVSGQPARLNDLDTQELAVLWRFCPTGLVRRCSTRCARERKVGEAPHSRASRRNFNRRGSQLNQPSAAEIQNVESRIRFSGFDASLSTVVPGEIRFARGRTNDTCVDISDGSAATCLGRCTGGTVAATRPPEPVERCSAGDPAVGRTGARRARNRRRRPADARRSIVPRRGATGPASSSHRAAATARSRWTTKDARSPRTSTRWG